MRRLQLITLIALFVIGCGRLKDPESAPSLLTIRGTLTNGSGLAIGGDVRVAVVWFGQHIGRADRDEKVTYTAAQDVAVEPKFPASFTVRLDALPPESAVVSKEDTRLELKEYFPDGSRWAIGTLLAYEDRNGNHKLDLIDVDASSTIDRVVGAQRELIIAYAEGGVPSFPQQDGLFSLGYNLLETHVCELFPGEPCHEIPRMRRLAADEAIELPLSQDPALNVLMCATRPDRDEVIDRGRGVPPAESLIDGECGEDGQMYFAVDACWEIDSLCFGKIDHCRSFHWTIPESEEDRWNWPCDLRDETCDDRSPYRPCPDPVPSRVRTAWTATISGDIWATNAQIAPDESIAIATIFEAPITIGDTTHGLVGGSDVAFVRVSRDGAITSAIVSGSRDGDGTRKVGIDRDGNAYITGWISERASMAETILEPRGADAFITKISSSGELVWARAIGGPLNDFGGGLGAHPSGGATVGMWFNGAADFGSGTIGAEGQYGLGLVRFGADGRTMWARPFEGDGDGWISDVEVDPRGRIYAGGRFEGSRDLGGGLVATAGERRNTMFVASYDDDGEHLWSKTFGGAGGYENVHEIKVHPSGDLIIAGLFRGTMDLGAPISSEGFDDGFVARIGPSGEHRWTRRFGGPWGDNLDAIAVGPSGEIALIGHFRGRVAFEAESFDAIGTYLVVLSANGEIELVQPIASGSPGASYPGAVGFYSNGDLFVVLSFGGEITLGGKTIRARQWDLLIARIAR
jgi:hypothetical protein